MDSHRCGYRNVLANYRIGKTLGHGSFGKVKLAVHNLTGIKVAIKILARQSLGETEAKKVRREINIMKRLSHPHVVRLFEVIETASEIFMVMEYVNSGELYYYITEKGRLEEDEARHFFQQIISGVEYCHSHMVSHRDLKPDNLLLDSKHNIKIADFGLSNFMRDGHFLKTNCGSPNYAAPELIAQRLYAGPEVDIWSCGVVLYALLCGRLPFDDDSITALYSRIRNGIYPLSSHMSSSASDLIARMLVVDPVERISVPEIRKHPWFQEQIPKYTASPVINTLYDTEKVNEDVVREMVTIGFNIHEVIGSLLNHLQNQATVTYYLLLHQHFQAHFSYDNNELLVSSLQEDTDHMEIYARSVSPVQEKWTLGFKSLASPHQTMADVLQVFHSLNVQWKRIGDYNMKCLWKRPRSKYSRDIFVDGCSQTKSHGDKTLPTRSSTGITIRTHDSVKFELQLYKVRCGMYIMDLQWLSGPPFLFLELSASFLSVVGII